MDFLGANAGDLGMLALGLVVAGLFSGLVAGMLGVGGGIVVVPVLYQVLAMHGVDPALRMHVAVGTSLATIIPTSISSVRSHDRKGAVDWALLRSWVAPMVVGVAIGSALGGLASGATLSLLFVVVAVPVAFYLAFGSENRRLSDHLPQGPAGLLVPGGIGGLSTMMGIGGGAMGVPAMTLCGVPIHRAIGTAAAFGTIISVPGTVGAILGGWHVQGLPAFSLGYVNLLGFILIAPVAYLAAPLGAVIAHRTDRRRLRMFFALFIALTAMRIMWDVI